jgi:hypothetical protein
MESSNHHLSIVPPTREWSLLCHRHVRFTYQADKPPLGIQQYRTKGSFRYCMSRMAPDGSQRERLAAIQATFQGRRQGPSKTRYNRHRRISRLSALGANHEHPAHDHPSRPCCQRTDPSQSPGTSVSLIWINCCVGCQYLRNQPSDIRRTTTWLLMGPWSHHQQ